MVRMKTLAILITYNPEIELLEKNLSALCPQVEHILVCDNASMNQKEIGLLVAKFHNVSYIENSTNLGLPVNYNRGVQFAIENHYDWLLTMDQDTIVPENMIKEYSQVYQNEKIAIISPVLVDINLDTETDILNTLSKDEYTSIDLCISSASLNRVSTLIELGGFDEKMFIDFVDYDYCKNVKQHGYEILRCNKVLIKHQIGKAKRVRVLGLNIISFNHSPFRKYYYFRNRIYYARKYHISFLQENYYYRSLFKQFIVLFVEEHTLKKIWKALKGTLDGLFMKIEANDKKLTGTNQL